MRRRSPGRRERRRRPRWPRRWCGRGTGSAGGSTSPRTPGRPSPSTCRQPGTTTKSRPHESTWEATGSAGYRGLQLIAAWPSRHPLPVQPLSQRMETLAALEPSPFPVISLYLSLTPNQNGRESHDQFVRKVFSDRAKALPAESPERESFEKDAERIRQYLDDEKQQSWQGARDLRVLRRRSVRGDPAGDRRSTITGCSSARSPHLYPLAKLVDTYPRYAAVLARHQQGAHPGLRSGCRRARRTGRQRQDAPHLEGRLVAGALSAPRRQRPHAIT